MANHNESPKLPGVGKSSYDLIDPGALWAELNLPQGITFLDLGCGQGNYSLAVANLIGPAGVVYAVDLWEEGIASLKERAAREGRANLRPLVAPAGRLPMESRSVDVGFMATVLHDLVEAGTAAGALAEVTRVLKPGGASGHRGIRQDGRPAGAAPAHPAGPGGSGSPGGPLRLCPAADREARAIQLLDYVY